LPVLPMLPTCCLLPINPHFRPLICNEAITTDNSHHKIASPDTSPPSRTHTKEREKKKKKNVQNNPLQRPRMPPPVGPRRPPLRPRHRLLRLSVVYRSELRPRHAEGLYCAVRAVSGV